MVDYNLYRESLKEPFIKLCRLRFLNPDHSTAFALDNNSSRIKNKCFIANGNLSMNLQNGQRRTATITLDNVDHEFDYNVNHVWFGREVAIDEGLILKDGTEYYIQQGVFLLTKPAESIQPIGRTIEYSLVDKWANLDGTLYGNLEGTYEVPLNSNPFDAIETLLREDKGNGQAIDDLPLIKGFTTWENTPYTVTVDADGTLAQVVLSVVETLAGLVGYDRNGRLRIEPSSDDVDDSTKPVQWTFGMDETTLLGLTYNIKNEEVFNDYIVVGEQLENGSQPRARVQNLDPRSDTNINIIGRKTKRESASGYANHTQCLDLAVWRVQRAAVLSKAVTVQSSQIFHIEENQLIEIVRSDKPGSPIEKHLVQGFSRPLASAGAMTINAISVVDIPDYTIVEDTYFMASNGN